MRWPSLGAMMPTIAEIQRNALRALIPPPRLRLSEWIEREIRLPEGVSAQPGPVRLWSFQREIADAIGDPLLERVSLVKPVRVGFTTLLTSALAAFVANDPAPSLGNLYGDAARKAGIDARLHGLRKAFCVYWAEQGMTVHQIAAMAGHTSLAEVERYTKAADRKRIVRAIAEGA